MAPRKTTATKATPAKKAAPAPAAEPAPAPKAAAPKVKHFATGLGCSCGYRPNFDHAIGVGPQLQHHLSRSNKEE